MKTITIGITDCGRYENYQRWIAQESGVEIIRLGPELNTDDLKHCDGIILTGGEDVHPRYYNRLDYVDYCHEIDEKRDALEWRVLDHTEEYRTPVLGICRGLQVVNVYLGGTLFPHIPAFGKFDHAKTGSVDRYHGIQVDPNSLLKGIVGADEGEINSAHHQAADRIGKGLVTNALSPDGIVEGLEREVRVDGEFLLLVQWHPERMTNPESPFSKNIKSSFLEAVQKAKQ